MELPDYNGGSIVNLMSSIGNLFGLKSMYPPLNNTLAKHLEGAENIFLVIIDGLGYKYLTESAKNSPLNKYLKGKMTSVFPSTTAAALTSFYTGIAPKNHAIMAWFTYFKEVGLISAVPPMVMRSYKYRFVNRNLQVSNILNFESFFNKINTKGYLLSPKDMQNGPYSWTVRGNSQQIGYSNFNELFQFGQNILEKMPGNKMIMGYWPGFDSSAHLYGLSSKQTSKHLEMIGLEFEKFIDLLKSGNPDIGDPNSKNQKTRIIITADHGMLDVPPEKKIFMGDHPELQSTLTLPLCGEKRLPFCYVRPSKTDIFEKYIENNLSEYCTAITAKEAISGEYFGLYEENPKLFDRVGDYILLMKDNYIMEDELLGESRPPLVGYHGGTTEDEMFVPFIVI